MGILDQVTQEFINALHQDGEKISHLARSLFYYLAVIQLALTSLMMVVRGESLQRFVATLLQLILSLGFFYGLIQLGGQWVPDMINGFIRIGETSGMHSIDPSSVLGQGLTISASIWHAFMNWGLLAHTGVAIAGVVVCIAIVIIYAFMAAELTVILVKAYALVSLSGLFFAFGGSDYTRRMVSSYIQSAIGIGLQLMTLYLLLSVGQQVGAQWAKLTAAAAAQHQLEPMFVVLGAVIVYYLVLKNVPSFVAGLSGVGGFRNYGEAAVGAALTAASSGANALVNAKGLAGSGVRGLSELGRGGGSLGRGAAGTFQAAGGGFGGVRAAAKNMASNLGSAVGNTVKDMALRQNGHLSMGQHVNHHLANKVAK